MIINFNYLTVDNNADRMVEFVADIVKQLCAQFVAHSSPVAKEAT